MGRFIGRLGVVPMPVIEQGLGVVDRVVRRHVAKLEKVGWCERMATIRGDGMLVWLTPPGLDGVGLGELPAVRAPQRFSPRTSHSIRVAWAAADIQRAAHRWLTHREMRLAPSQWGIQVANERGGLSRRLPDLAYLPASADTLHVAVVIDEHSNPRRERAALEGWRASILAGQYAHVRYVAGLAAATHLSRVATELGLTASQFSAGDHVVADEIAVEPPILENLGRGPAAVTQAPLRVDTAPLAPPDLPRPSAAHVVPQSSSSQEPAETPERTAAQQRLITQLLGHDERPRRRRWRRRAI
ncbi:MAG TPA: hypothetical protein VMF14_08415 [Solirubrobacteraceae bacterium]|nr:hypothetical protein [Solirubrobacteraceae bacterium]